MSNEYQKNLEQFYKNIEEGIKEGNHQLPIKQAINHKPKSDLTEIIPEEILTQLKKYDNSAEGQHHPISLEELFPTTIKYSRKKRKKIRGIHSNSTFNLENVSFIINADNKQKWIKSYNLNHNIFLKLFKKKEKPNYVHNKLKAEEIGSKINQIFEKYNPKKPHSLKTQRQILSKLKKLDPISSEEWRIEHKLAKKTPEFGGWQELYFGKTKKTIKDPIERIYENNNPKQTLEKTIDLTINPNSEIAPRNYTNLNYLPEIIEIKKPYLSDITNKLKNTVSKITPKIKNLYSKNKLKDKTSFKLFKELKSLRNLSQRKKFKYTMNGLAILFAAGSFIIAKEYFSNDKPNLENKISKITKPENNKTYFPSQNDLTKIKKDLKSEKNYQSNSNLTTPTKHNPIYINGVEIKNPNISLEELTEVGRKRGLTGVTEALTGKKVTNKDYQENGKIYNLAESIGKNLLSNENDFNGDGISDLLTKKNIADLVRKINNQENNDISYDGNSPKLTPEDYVKIGNTYNNASNTNSGIAKIKELYNFDSKTAIDSISNSREYAGVDKIKYSSKLADQIQKRDSALLLIDYLTKTNKDTIKEFNNNDNDIAITNNYQFYKAKENSAIKLLGKNVNKKGLNENQKLKYITKLMKYV